MTEAGDEKPPRRVDPLYYADREGVIHLFSGDLQVLDDGIVETLSGSLTLRLENRASLDGHLTLPSHRRRFSGSDARIVGIQDGQSLHPARRRQLSGFTDSVLTAEPLVVGDLDEVSRLLVHVAGELTSWLPNVEVQGGGFQRRLDFDLLGWPGALVAASSPGQRADPADFTHVVELTPPVNELRADAIEVLGDCLFTLLSFIAAQDVGTSVTVGVNDADAPVWASWAPPRRAWGHPGIRWCPPQIVPDALPAVAEGLASLWADHPRREAVRRAIGYLGVAVRGLLEVRVPMTCVGLEVLASEVLQRVCQLSPSKVDDLNAGVRLKRLIEVSEIPSDLPSSLPALRERLVLAGTSWSGPELLADVRNWLVHPTKLSKNLAAPTKQELIEAWQLATWYLELAILYQLGYKGSYSTRLTLGGWEGTVEPVPWASPD